MIDLHSHILPDVDDGAPDWDSSLAMMAMAAQGGTSILVATPHSHEYWRGEVPARDTILRLVAEANERAAQAGLALTVLPGQECRDDPDLADDLRRGTWLTLGDSKTVLLEFPFTVWPPHADSLVFELQVAGYTVLLAHPERYTAVVENPNLIFDLVEKGVLAQVTSTAVIGRFGPKTQETARLLLDHGLAHVLASDAHTTRGRNPDMAEAHANLQEWYGEEAARRLVWDNPQALLQDKHLVLPSPRRVEPQRKKKLFGWLG